MNVKFCPIASGSDGNSIYIGTDETHILIDAGISGKRIEEGLNNALNISGKCLDALFITHEHSDHIQGAGVLSRRFDLPVYATEKTWEEMDKCPSLGKIASHNRRYVYEEEHCIINDIVIKPFEIPHDAVQPVGYCVYAGDRKISVATDMGHVTDIIKESIKDSDILLLESNHDIEMLKNGSYPYYLKQRILGQKGHLSNAAAGGLLSEIFTDRLKHVFLGHLSKENNRPLIAFDTVSTILNANNICPGKSLKLFLAQRGAASEAIII